MAISVTCAKCQRTLHTQGELAGKRVKCPGCGSAVAVPSAPVEPEPAEPAAEATPAEKKDKKRRKKKKSGKSREATPLFSAMGIEFTPMKLLVTLSIMLIMGTGVWALFALTPLKGLFASATTAEVVDVYTAVNGVRYATVGERVLNSKSVNLNIPGPRQLLITRKSPEGQYLLVKVRVSQKDVDVYYSGARGQIFLTRSQIRIKDGDEWLEPWYVVDTSENGKVGYHFGFAPTKEGSSPLTNYLGPRGDGWGHEGDLKNEDNTLTFEGKRGMKVTTRISDKRMDGDEDHTPLDTLTGRKHPKDGDKPGLVAGPGSYVLVTWDQQSVGYLVEDQVERPNDISLSWDIVCLFRKPKSGGNEVLMEALGKQRKIKY